MKGYTRIDTQVWNGERYDMWESNTFGDESEAIVTNSSGDEVGRTWDSLDEFLKDYMGK